MLTAAAASSRQWDVIVIGTGMGAATAGYALAKAGRRVLFCERGRSSTREGALSRGLYAEQLFARDEAPSLKHREILARAGRYNDEIEDVSGGVSRFIPFIGCTTGGSSSLYGMALERLHPGDFYPREHYLESPSSTLPDRWPVNYEQLLPFYEQAEQLYRVRGEADVLRGEFNPRYRPLSSALSPRSQELFDFLSRKGLHPYRLPQACEFVPGCAGCQGYLCARNCKNDSSRICLEPALHEFQAELLDECEVLKLVATRHRVTAVECVHNGQGFTLRGDIIVLGAGALATPKLLLDSASAQWPSGLANDSGMVGKNLMRHHIDLYAIFTHSKLPTDGNPKEIAFNDFYFADGQKLGSVQSFGFLPPSSIVAASMAQDLRDAGLGWISAPFHLFKPALSLFLEWIHSRTAILATIGEDLPYSHNRVTVRPGSEGRTQLSLTYRVSNHDKFRIAAFRAKMRRALAPYRFVLLKQAENNQRIAHACGTCRFGQDPTQSVLDENNKAHGLENLYVVDASFFPSSGGTNPALTIAANALRVASHICGPELD